MGKRRRVLAEKNGVMQATRDTKPMSSGEFEELVREAHLHVLRHERGLAYPVRLWKKFRSLIHI